MDNEKRKIYSEVLLNAYQNGVFKVIWSTSGFSMAIDSKKKDLNSSCLYTISQRFFFVNRFVQFIFLICSP